MSLLDRDLSKLTIFYFRAWDKPMLTIAAKYDSISDTFEFGMALCCNSDYGKASFKEGAKIATQRLKDDKTCLNMDFYDFLSLLEDLEIAEEVLSGAKAYRVYRDYFMDLQICESPESKSKSESATDPLLSVKSEPKCDACSVRDEMNLEFRDIRAGIERTSSNIRDEMRTQFSNIWAALQILEGKAIKENEGLIRFDLAHIVSVLAGRWRFGQDANLDVFLLRELPDLLPRVFKKT